jgi:hypothetical protein
MKGRLIAVAAVAAAVSLGACGGGGEDDEVRAVVEKWFVSISDRDYKAACALLTDSARKQFTQGVAVTSLFPCDKALEVVTEDLTDDERADFKRIRVRDVQRSGSSATIPDKEVEFPPELDHMAGDDGEPAILRRLGDRWRIDRLG